MTTTIYLTTSQQAHGDQTPRAAKQAERHFAELSQLTRAELIERGLGRSLDKVLGQVLC